jgi:hypothetical protein
MTKDSGYRGLWSASGSLLTDAPWRFVHYSGGLATAFQQHIPIAYYDAESHKTFFCYSGTPPDKPRVRCMVSCFDHATRTVPKPTLVIEKKTDDAHENAALMLDAERRLWVFSSAHGTDRPAYVFRSRKPCDIDSFDLIQETCFSYPQPWFVEGMGFLFLHTRYVEGRRLLHWMTSPDGLRWSPPHPLAVAARGHYQISWRIGSKVATAFNYHPERPRPDDDVGRTNLYYLETNDLGATWRTAGGDTVTPPIRSPDTAALVHDYESEGVLVYLKDLNFDAAGRPVILHLVSRSGAAGPAGDPRRWRTARWDGSDWVIRDARRSGNNFDTGCLHIEPDGLWRVIAPTEPGPQPYNVGGQVAVWTSPDQGATWVRDRVVTRDPSHNHSYVRRPVHAHPDFYALWAAADTRRPSESHLYFCNARGDRLVQLPYVMARETCQCMP